MGLLANSDGINKAKTRPRANLLRRTATEFARHESRDKRQYSGADRNRGEYNQAGRLSFLGHHSASYHLFTVTFNIWLVTLPLFVRLPDT